MTRVIQYLAACRIPLSLGNKVSSRLLARAARALLAPGAGPITNANGKPINSDSTLTTIPSTQSATSTTDLRDSPSAVALRSGAGNLIDNPNALGGRGDSRTSPDELEDQAEDPFIKDTEDLVRSMQTSSPSWNDTNDAAAAVGTASPSYSDSKQAEDVDQPSDEQFHDNRNNNGDGSSKDNSDGRYVTADAASSSSSGAEWQTDGAIDMVVFDKGESRAVLKQSVASNNGPSR